MPSRTTAPTTLAQGREAFDQQAWADAEALLSAADGEDPLAPADLERLAIATYLLGRYEESSAVTRRAYQESIRLGDVGRAARAAFWVAVEHLGRGEMAPAAGWLARAERLVDYRRCRAGRIGLPADRRSGKESCARRRGGRPRGL